MNYLSLISLVCFAAVLVNASSETGYYVPKGYYVIHADGQQSELSKITPSHQLLLHRLRRAAQFSSSSSSSSSSSFSNGGPVSFHQSTSSHVSPGGQGYYSGVVGSLNNRFNGDDDYNDDYYDGTVPLNNNRPGYSSSHIQTGTFAGNGFNGPSPSYTSSQTQISGNGFPSRINTQSSGGPNYNTGNTVISQSSSISRPTGHGVQTQSQGVLYPSSNGNVVYTQTNNNGVVTQTSGLIYPDGQVQITSHKTGKF